MRAAVDFEDGGGAVGLLEVSVDGPVVDLAVGFPDGFAGRLVEGDDELLVDAVAVEDQQVLEEDRGGGGAAILVDFDVAA